MIRWHHGFKDEKQRTSSFSKVLPKYREERDLLDVVRTVNWLLQVWLALIPTENILSKDFPHSLCLYRALCKWFSYSFSMLIHKADLWVSSWCLYSDKIWLGQRTGITAATMPPLTASTPLVKTAIRLWHFSSESGLRHQLLFSLNWHLRSICNP